MDGARDDAPDDASRDAFAHASEPALDEGRYDAVIVGAEMRDDGLALSCAITSGDHRGDVVDLVSRAFGARDPIALLGLPCTLAVARDGIRIER